MNGLFVTKDEYLDFSKETIIMGILNVTPDSFSDGGKYASIPHAIQHAKQMVEDGAKIIDVGGESTRPGHTPVDETEEINRVVPAIEALADEISAPISIDTFKAKTAERAVQAGAKIINDVWGAKHDPEIAAVAKSFNAPIILMHQEKVAKYEDLMDNMKNSLSESIEIAKSYGVPDDKIILDPGIGFAKSLHHDLLAMRRLGELRTLGYPILIGTSRKSIIGDVLGLPVGERLEGTIATVCQGIREGAHIVRVHDVKEIKRAVKMMDAMIGKGDRLYG